MIDITAYHEAGHAIACLAYNVEIYECWIKDDGTTRTPTGRVRHADIAPTCRTAILISIAGEIAQRRYEPSSLDGHLQSALRSDRDNTRRVLTNLAPTEAEREAILAECKGEVAALIEVNWEAVAVLANALLSRQRLTGAEVTEIVGTVGFTDRW